MRTVERSQLINATKNQPAKGEKFRDYKYNPKAESLSELSTLFGVPLKKDSYLYLEESSHVERFGTQGNDYGGEIHLANENQIIDR